MKFVRLLLLHVLPLAASFAAVPTITVVLNNYSHTLPSSPDYGIAPGSVFVIYGADLADKTSDMQSAPLPDSLAGVQVGLAAGGQRALAQLYYVSPTQIIGVLPASWPVSTSTLSVNNNGKPSATRLFKVVANAFGILTNDGSGFGPATAYDIQSERMDPPNFTRPGDTIAIYGSGASGLPITVEIGGREAEVLYRYNIFPGLDQINLHVPYLTSGGLVCNLPLVVKSGGISSNITTIPVAVGGDTCPPPVSGNTDPSITEADIERWSAAGSYTTGYISLSRRTDSSNRMEESYVGYFSQYGGPGIAEYLRDNSGSVPPKAGQCTSNAPAPVLPAYWFNIYYFDLNVGSFLHMTGPNGTLIGPLGQDHYPQGNVGYYTSPSPVSNLGATRYTFSSPGGTGGPFAGSLEIGPELVWTNREEAREIPWNRPFTVRWTGGDAGQMVQIWGIRSGTGVRFTCYANISEGEFTVPASVMTSMLLNGNRIDRIGLYTTGRSTRIQAEGIDHLTLNYNWSTQESVTFK